MKSPWTLSLVCLALTGCVTVPPVDHPVVELPVQEGQRYALAQSGRSILLEGFVQNGVVVTPSKNYYFGQTEGLQWDPQAEPPGHSNYQPPAVPALPQGPQLPAYGQGMQTYPLGGGAALAYSAPGGAVAPRTGPSGRFPSNTFHDRVSRALEALNGNALAPLGGNRMASLDAPTPRFAAGSAVLSAADREALKDFARTVKAREVPVIINVAGYTSAEGPGATNERIAMSRAQAVRQALAEGGLRSRFLLAYGKPQCCYAEGNDTPQGRAANRRVELTQGGRFADTLDFDSQDVAIAIARARHAVRGVPNVELRVHVQAPEPGEAQRVQQDLFSILGREGLPARNGVVATGPNSVVIEVIS